MFRRFMIVLLVFLLSGATGITACSKSEEAQKIESDFSWHYKHCAEDPEFYKRFELGKHEYFEEFPIYPLTDEEIKDSLYHQVWSCECIGDLLVKFGGVLDSTAGTHQVLEHISAECADKEQARKIAKDLVKERQEESN